MGILILLALLTVLVSFTCSLLESTLLSTPMSYLAMKEDEGDRKAIRLKNFKSDIDRPLSSILILNTIANTMGAAAVGARAAQVWGSATVGVVSAVMTVLILIFSEIIPKTIGANYWKSFVGFTGSVVRVLTIVLYPLVKVAEWITNIFGRDEPEVTFSREEVSAMANTAEEEGEIEKNENKIIQNLIKLDNVKAYDVMTPRVVAAIASEKMTLRNFYKDPNFRNHSRIPVYNDSPEFITGYILRSVALEYLAEDKFDARLLEIKRPISLYNEDTSISDIWESLLQRKEQIALIIDEYGCFQGIITLEDIIETIFGLEIIDERDEAIDMQQYARERWAQRQKKYQKIQLPDPVETEE